MSNWLMGLALGLAFGMTAGSLAGQRAIKADAFMRGFMVECIGKSGYFWECEK